MINQNNENNIWLLLDDRAGNCSQVLGVGKALKSKYISKNIKYNNLSKLPNILLKETINHIKLSDRKQFKPPWPKIIIGCGRKSAPIGLWIKKQSNNYSKYIQIMWPSYPYKDIDLIFTPYHDKVSPKKNVMNIITAPNIIDKNLLDKSKLKWKKNLELLNKPRIAIIIGGDTKKYKLTSKHISLMFSKIKNVISKDISLMITTSRRTSKNSFKRIKKEIADLNNQKILWDINSNSPNPYYGFLSYADIVIVTGDSISICSEVCATGKPLLIFAPDDITLKKHKLFHRYLINKGIAKYIDEFSLNNIKNIKYKSINEANNIAKIIKTKYLDD